MWKTAALGLALVMSAACTPSGADGLCLSSAEVERLNAKPRPTDEEAQALLGHYGVCLHDAAAEQKAAERLADADVPTAVRHLAVVNLNTSRNLETVVPLLRRAARLGDKRAANDLRGLMSSTAVADAFGIERVRPKVAIDVPARFKTPSAADIVELCRAEDADARMFCDDAISQVMIESDACPGAPFALTVAAIRRRIVTGRPDDARSGPDFVRSAVAECDASVSSAASTPSP